MLSFTRAIGESREISSQPLWDVCITFAVLETFFIVAFIFSWVQCRAHGGNSRTAFVLIFGGYLFSLGVIAIGPLQVTIGAFGDHTVPLPPRTLQTALQLEKALQLVFYASIPWPKLALLYHYIQLSERKLVRYIVYATSVAVMVPCVFGLVTGFFNCRPFASFWNPQTSHTCTIDPVVIVRFLCVMDIATDAVILLLPLSLSRWKQVDISIKAGLLITSLLICSGITAAVLRVVSTLKADILDDISFGTILSTSLAVIECGVYVIVSTIPGLSPGFRRIFGRTNNTVLLAPRLSELFRSSLPARSSTASLPAPPRRVLSKKSSLSQYNYFDRLSPQTPPLDEHQWMWMRDSPRSVAWSMDEESLVCASAILHERLASEGRNPDGTLKTWSLQPLQTSPLRSSFVFTDDILSSNIRGL